MNTNKDTEWLRETLAAIDRVFWHDELEHAGVQIRWGRWRRTKLTFKFGCLWHGEPKVIEINPILAYAWVPYEVAGFTVYHETIHAMRDKGPLKHHSRYRHDKDFREAELKYPRIANADAWTAEHLNALILAKPPKGLK